MSFNSFSVIAQSSLFIIILFTAELTKEPLHGLADATFNHVASVVALVFTETGEFALQVSTERPKLQSDKGHQ